MTPTLHQGREPRCGALTLTLAACRPSCRFLHHSDPDSSSGQWRKTLQGAPHSMRLTSNFIVTLKQVLLPCCSYGKKSRGEVRLLKVTQMLSAGGAGASAPRQCGLTLLKSHEGRGQTGPLGPGVPATLVSCGPRGFKTICVTKIKQMNINK